MFHVAHTDIFVSISPRPVCTAMLSICPSDGLAVSDALLMDLAFMDLAQHAVAQCHAAAICKR